MNQLNIGELQFEKLSEFKQCNSYFTSDNFWLVIHKLLCSIIGNFWPKFFNKKHLKGCNLLLFKMITIITFLYPATTACRGQIGACFQNKGKRCNSARTSEANRWNIETKMTSITSFIYEIIHLKVFSFKFCLKVLIIFKVLDNPTKMPSPFEAIPSICFRSLDSAMGRIHLLLVTKKLAYSAFVTILNLKDTQYMQIFREKCP